MSCYIFHALCDTALYPVVFDSGNQWKPLIAPLVINTLKKAFSIHHHQQIFISQMLHCSLRFCDINRPKWHDVKRQVLQMVVEGKKRIPFPGISAFLWAALLASLVDLLSLLDHIHYFQCNKMHWPGVLLSFTMKASRMEKPFFSLSPSLCLISLLIKMINAKSQQHPVPCWFWLLWRRRKCISKFDLLIFVDHG